MGDTIFQNSPSKSGTKHAVLTGATSGLGLETARLLINEGWKLSLFSRNEKKTKKVIDNLIKNTRARVDYYISDFTELHTVKAACKKFTQTNSSIDVIINNAGCLTQGRKVSKEGWEYSLAINYLAPFLMLQLLDPLLHLESRVININSARHANQSLNLQSLNEYSGYKAYAHSKLANALMVVELSKRNRLAYCADPGVMGTNFGGNLSLPLKMIMTMIKPFLPGAKSSASQSVYLATAPIEELENGDYYSNSVLTGYSASLDQSEQLWERTKSMLGEYLSNKRA